ncbi:MAG: hypothetical protein WCZ46_07900 [Proteiniphilum sp.]
MKTVVLFLKKNILSLLGMVLGLLGGYCYWFYFGIYDGTSWLSSELWVNCLYGMLFGGLIGSYLATMDKKQKQPSA